MREVASRAQIAETRADFARLAETHGTGVGVVALCDSHEQLRAELDATRAVARRYRDGYTPINDEYGCGWYWHRDDAVIVAPKPMTFAERQALDAIETDHDT